MELVGCVFFYPSSKLGGEIFLLVMWRDKGLRAGQEEQVTRVASGQELHPQLPSSHHFPNS